MGQTVKDNVVEVTGCLLKQYVRYLRCLYLIQIKLTLSGTNICVHETATTSYVKKISVMNFHTLEVLLYLQPHKKISRSLVGLCFTLFVTAAMLSQI